MPLLLEIVSNICFNHFYLETLATIRSQTLKRERLKEHLVWMKYFSRVIVWKMFSIRCSRAWKASRLCKYSHLHCDFSTTELSFTVLYIPGRSSSCSSSPRLPISLSVSSSQSLSHTHANTFFRGKQFLTPVPLASICCLQMINRVSPGYWILSKKDHLGSSACTDLAPCTSSKWSFSFLLFKFLHLIICLGPRSPASEPIPNLWNKPSLRLPSSALSRS